jgi:hypothetical protein
MKGFVVLEKWRWIKFEGKMRRLREGYKRKEDKWPIYFIPNERKMYIEHFSSQYHHYMVEEELMKTS